MKNVLYNCRRATFLIEKKSLSKISVKESLALKIHLAGCSVCKLFQQQSTFINQMVKKHVLKEFAKNIQLDEKYKQNLSEKIHLQITHNKNT